MELELNSATVCFLIDKAREFHAKEAVTIIEEPNSPTDDWALQVLADHRDDATYQEMVDTISDLEPDQQIALVALMWLGRGDFSLGEWKQALRQAGDAYNNRSADYLIATPLVADYWQEGLIAFGRSCDED